MVLVVVEYKELEIIDDEDNGGNDDISEDEQRHTTPNELKRKHSSF